MPIVKRDLGLPAAIEATLQRAKMAFGATPIHEKCFPIASAMGPPMDMAVGYESDN